MIITRALLSWRYSEDAETPSTRLPPDGHQAYGRRIALIAEATVESWRSVEAP
ncbi:hypothetical protein AB0L44_02825 [Nonomuraea wenchangensis]|uniref:hypothetical protein n=1 Tax=Nonomuraea wenchangensis TaxID=568860 RepID=UPI0034296A18